MKQTDKRRILAEVLTGNVDTLKRWSSQRQAEQSPYRWIIDARAVRSIISIVDKQSNENTISEQEFNRLSKTISVVQLIDYSGGMPIPEPDED